MLEAEQGHTRDLPQDRPGKAVQVIVAGWRRDNRRDHPLELELLMSEYIIVWY